MRLLRLRRCGAAADPVSDELIAANLPGAPGRGRDEGSCCSSAPSSSGGYSSSGSDSDEGECEGRAGARGRRARRESSASCASDSELGGGCGGGCGGGLLRTAHSATTPDGWRLHLHRVRAPAGAAPARRHPVVLCPGLASGGIESFDLDPRVSMAAHLARRGYDVWVPDLRGNGRSDRPSWWDRSTWWTVDEHLALDLPTVIAAVLAETGAASVHWVGHSMGGMLAVGALSRGLECASALRSVTLLASGCFGAGSWHSLVGPGVRAVAAAGFHAGHVVPFVSRLRGALAPLAWAVQSLFFVRSNVDPEIGAKLMGSFLSFIPSGVVAQFMGSLNSELGISSSDGSFNYADPKALAHVSTPVFGINGARDLFCPAAGGLKTISMFKGPHRRFLFLGPAYGTAKDNYGHFCPLVGRRAPVEVFPQIEAFISEFDAPHGAWPAPPASPLPVPAPVAPAGPAGVA
ncbi:alpha beta hydrolase [Raphidocelis subcapitata]|uniref:Alpha beta hydrolase n=1 Tax=Raphidocelis subcapitata TaxID=307507 RepID=A0A2V0NJF7_9CHLO|nr:alpha beta hydrolase [Raphidocelis subcapitata]|eukprot:GBF87341.1 alpha beta hydrolase [Raphidocelis subcapitata]